MGSTPTIADAGPEASRIAAAVSGDAQNEIECFRCGYSLRGLTELRCPECGLTFDWADVHDPARRRHPYLFEHHSQRGAIRPFIRTIRGPLNPWRFWATLRLQQPCIPRRLLGFWLLFVVAYFVCLPVWYTVLDCVVYGSGLGLPAQMNFFFLRQRIIMWTIVFLLPLVIQAVTVASLLVFQQSLGRWRIRSYHVVRCGVYGAALLLPGAILLGLGCGFWLLVDSGLLGTAPWLPSSGVAQVIVGGVVFVAVLHWHVSLWCGYRRYLKVARPFAMILSSQAIAALVVFNLLLVISYYSGLVESWFRGLFWP